MKNLSSSNPLGLPGPSDEASVVIRGKLEGVPWIPLETLSGQHGEAFIILGSLFTFDVYTQAQGDAVPQFVRSYCTFFGAKKRAYSELGIF